MSTVRTALATIALASAAVIVGVTTAGADTITPPPTPAWQNRPCPLDHTHTVNCFWNHATMGGTVDYFVRRLPNSRVYCVFYSDPTLARSYDACYAGDYQAN